MLIIKIFEEVIIDMGGRLAISPPGDLPEPGEKVTINGRPARVLVLEMFLTKPPRPTGSFAFEFLDVCTCDSSFTCFGHMEQEEWDAVRGEN